MGITSLWLKTATLTTTVTDCIILLYCLYCANSNEDSKQGRYIWSCISLRSKQAGDDITRSLLTNLVIIHGHSAPNHLPFRRYKAKVGLECYLVRYCRALWREKYDGWLSTPSCLFVMRFAENYFPYFEKPLSFSIMVSLFGWDWQRQIISTYTSNSRAIIDTIRLYRSFSLPRRGSEPKQSRINNVGVWHVGTTRYVIAWR